MIIIGPQKVITVRPSRETIPTLGPIQAHPAVVVTPSRTIRIEPAVGQIVQPPPRGVWDENGWSHQASGRDHIYQGTYRVYDPRRHQFSQYHGRIVERGNEIIPYIADPPYQIKHHPKGPCFVLESTPWFRVHWHHPARNVDDAILYIQKVLEEALNHYS
jgi:hypothetical protein